MDDITSEGSFYLAEVIANDLLSEESGQFALKIAYRFISFNTEWVQNSLGMTTFESSAARYNQTVSVDESLIMPLVKPWTTELFPQSNALAMMNRIGGSIFDVEETDNHHVTLLLKPLNVSNKPNNVAEGVWYLHVCILQYLFLKKSEKNREITAVISNFVVMLLLFDDFFSKRKKNLIFLMQVNILGELMIRNLLDMEIPWEIYVKSVFTPPINKLTIEKMLTKRMEFHLNEDESVCGLIRISDGNSMSISGSLQPDEKRMLEMLFTLIQEYEESSNGVENAMNAMKM